MPLRTLIVDDHAAIRDGVPKLLEYFPIEICAAMSDGESALSFLRDQRNAPDAIDAVLLDVQLPNADGLATLASIRQWSETLPVVMFSMFDYPVYIARAATLGAQDFVLKSDSAQTIAETLLHAAQKLQPRPSGLMGRVVEKLAEKTEPSQLPSGFPLTGREAQVLRHIAMGLSNREISQSLSISVETVKEHVQNVLRKTQATDRTDVAVRAVRNGLVD